MKPIRSAKGRDGDDVQVIMAGLTPLDNGMAGLTPLDKVKGDSNTER